jgi:predicted esterase
VWSDTAAVRILNIQTPTHGRVLVREVTGPSAVMVGFHGYTESAEIQMDRLLGIPGAERWLLISVQGLHRFYRGRTQEVGAGWMTRQDRELMIADNIAYADRVLEGAAPEGLPLVTVGFSQGVAMAFRVAARGRRRTHGVIAVGGDVPPELLADASVILPPTLILRGELDDWYTADKLSVDRSALASRGVDVAAVTYAGGHEWTDDVQREAGQFMGRVCTPPR